MLKLPKWEKQGKIFSRENGDFFKSHAMRVIPYLRKNGVLRLFFSSRCINDMMHPTYIDVNPENPKEIIGICEHSLLKIGNPGLFDDSGITLASIVRNKNASDKDYIYYTGWKRRRYGIPFELSIGVASIKEDGDILEKVFSGPILAQDISHPFLVGGPFVIKSNTNDYRMWYCSGTDWKEMPHGWEPIYTVFHSTSDDGIHWTNHSTKPVIPYCFANEVVSAPWVVSIQGLYLMYYPYRGSESPINKHYTIGVATSEDGITWERRDSEVGIEKSANGWDSEMICYPAIYNYGDKTYMFYSGNGVGRGGIGYAVADRKLDIIDF
ncbi:hypothetical protein [Pseudanabaena minima]|uniref:hypothetical protein n=1 Tax=Pseudanabaena minima TaxID=890415 RepID=UPI003DAA3A1A